MDLTRLEVLDAVPGDEPTPDVWARLARLNGRCHSSLDSFEVTPVFNQSLHWRVTIRLRGEPADSPLISVVNAHAADAIERGIVEAEARGWHLPALVSPKAE